MLVKVDKVLLYADNYESGQLTLMQDVGVKVLFSSNNFYISE